MAALSPPSTDAYVVSLESVVAARDRIRPLGIGVTPVFTCDIMDRLSGHELYFKGDLFQKTGSFKSRGATNACAKLPKGSAVVTHSSGNFAQALAFAGSASGLHATIVMPSNAPLPKQQATAGYGADVRFCEPTTQARVAAAAATCEELGGVFVHPSEDPDVIAGQGTIALEVLDQILPRPNAEEGSDTQRAPLDAVVVPVGGGGLISGIATVIKARFPDMIVVGAEPSAVDDAFRSKACGSIQTNEQGVTSVADGLKTQLGPNTWPVVRDKVDVILRVDEDDIISATKLVWTRMKLQIEPSAGVGVAVALGEDLRCLVKERLGDETRARIGVVLCGGNADPVALAPLFAVAPEYPKGCLS
eukprot:CAMPEP_0185753996 /NCGR_PEP_ID=MMETSP1174-20130828/12658_1 /TAXON_ID=35687 /ORGANISM="Dictyocha speculum, Strain CCMP1381" /LENGTH=360 /DNA_ID=CAMNT_0028432035 /DNA_START=47 /DNA_END=1129 /DNA_ORIENTATION=+